MLFYKFILLKIINSIALSSLILSSVLYIFSIIELLGNSYELLNILILGLINTLELVMTIPTIIYVMSIIIFWNNIKKTNELLIIRHYISLKKIILIFSIFIIIFTYLETNKYEVKNHIENIKETYLKQSNYKDTIDKVFFIFSNDELKITRLKEINIESNHIEEISIYKFKDNLFLNSINSNDNLIDNDIIILDNPKIVTSETIKDLGKNYEIDIKEFGEYFYNNDKKINLYKNNRKDNRTNIIENILLIVILFTYISIFLSKRAIQKNASVLKYNFIAFTIFTYAFISSQIYLEYYNFLFQISVLLTFTIYLYKNLIDE